MSAMGAIPILYCSFCGKNEGQVRKLVAGPGVFICDECHDLIGEMMKDDTIGDPMRRGTLVELKAKLPK